MKNKALCAAAVFQNISSWLNPEWFRMYPSPDIVLMWNQSSQIMSEILSKAVEVCLTKKIKNIKLIIQDLYKENSGEILK